MISISTVEFRYYVVVIILVSLGKPYSDKGLRQLRVAFDIYVLWLLCSNKIWLAERFHFLSSHTLLLLEYFLFYFSNFIFLYDYQF